MNTTVSSILEVSELQRGLRQKLEENINTAIHEFQAASGLEVHGITVNRIDLRQLADMRPQSNFSGVTVEVKL